MWSSKGLLVIGQKNRDNKKKKKTIINNRILIAGVKKNNYGSNLIKIFYLLHPAFIFTFCEVRSLNRLRLAQVASHGSVLAARICPKAPQSQIHSMTYSRVDSRVDSESTDSLLR